MAPAPMPSIHAMLICDMVIKEAGSNKHSAIGIFTDVYASAYPMMLNPLAVYVCISDALGNYDLAMELVDLEQNKPLGRVQGLRLQSKEKLQSHDFGIRFVNTVFPHAGTYEFRLLADGRLLGGKTLRVRPLPQQPPQGGPPLQA
ncbi:MAG TPA: hypothetical protein VHF22_07360 [Planctomycetota bacterium]|nr:hypothetical protein [Planctomycetota bacterium]